MVADLPPALERVSPAALVSYQTKGDWDTFVSGTGMNPAPSAVYDRVNNVIHLGPWVSRGLTRSFGRSRLTSREARHSFYSWEVFAHEVLRARGVNEEYNYPKARRLMRKMMGEAGLGYVRVRRLFESR